MPQVPILEPGIPQISKRSQDALHSTPMRLCAITDRKLLAGEDEAALRRQLRGLVAGWIEGGVEFIQLREKDLNAYRLGSLAAEIWRGWSRGKRSCCSIFPLPLRGSRRWRRWPTACIFQAPPDGVRLNWCGRVLQRCGREAIVSMACHSVEDVELAREERADLVLLPRSLRSLGKKLGEKPQGLSELRRAGARWAAGCRCLRWVE